MADGFIDVAGKQLVKSEQIKHPDINKSMNNVTSRDRLAGTATINPDNPM
jgi:hypothetical protein